MDRIISTATEGRISGESWKAECDRLISFYSEITRVDRIEMFLPFGIAKQGNNLTFQTFETKDAHLKALAANEKLFYVTFFIRDEYTKKNMGIELTFPATIRPQFVTKIRGFIYRWNKDSVTIRKLLGTTRTTEIKNQVRLLLEECKRFYLIYCEPVTEPEPLPF